MTAVQRHCLTPLTYITTTSQAISCLIAEPEVLTLLAGLQKSFVEHGRALLVSNFCAHNVRY
jgi:hypothetical protein